MKILYINRAKSDYIQDFLYTGFVKIVGSENVIEYPWNSRFHINFRKHPKNLGLVSGNLLTSIKTSFSKTYDLVVLASCHKDVFHKYLEIIDSIPTHIPRVFLDGGDRPEIAGDLVRLGGKELYDLVVAKRPFDLIFKREYVFDRTYESNVLPLPMCFNLDLLPKLKSQKKYDVAFWAVESYPLRTKILEMVEDKFDCKENGSVSNQIMKKYKRKGDFYFQELHSCKIALNARGMGWDTLRYWELPAVGTFMLTQEPQILIYDNFVNEKEAVFFNDEASDLVDLCSYYLKHEKKRETIAQNGYLKLANHHTDKHRAAFVLEQVSKLKK